jgi:ubiquinone/menaquinone biosynthesis C-methylase UbiE
MKPETLSLLCDPRSREPLRLEEGPDGPFLAAPRSGHRYPVRSGIACFLEDVDLEGPNRRYQRLYDRMAILYDVSTRLYASFKRTTEATRRREYLGDLEIQAGDRVLEVSVGTGANLPLLPRGACYYGLDISWGMLRRCQRRAHRERLAVELFLAAAERLPFQDGSFDGVFHVGGINFFSDRGRAVAEMARVARPNTKIVIVDETEDFARRHEARPFARAFYGARPRRIEVPTDLVPRGMEDAASRLVAGGDLYCLSFRTPRQREVEPR